MAGNEYPARVELKIPCRPEFVGVARLAILGVASRMKFSYDEVEDVRLAVGEVCTNSVECAERNAKTDSELTLRSEIWPDKLVVDILDSAGDRAEENRSGDAEQESDIRWVLIPLLVDEVTVSPRDSGTHVRMVKYAGQR